MSRFICDQFRESRIFDTVGIDEEIREILAECRGFGFGRLLGIVIGFGGIVASDTKSAG
jgi:hypothetical protein